METGEGEIVVDYISLFSGVGGFEAGLDAAGMNCVAQVEIDTACQSILRRDKPDIVRIGDVKDAGRHNLPAAGLLCGGSPCTSFSVAGKRDGLSGESGLWYEFQRLLVELTPQWFIWENVPGVLSSGDRDAVTGQRRRGLDFAIVLAGFTGVAPEIPRNGWKNAGIANGWFYHVAWRVLDAQYWGVAQRRRRLFVVGCLAASGRNPAEVLFESPRLSWNYPSRKAARQSAAADAETGAVRHNTNVAGTLGSAGARNRNLGNANEADLLVTEPVTPDKVFRMRAFGDYEQDEISSVVAARDYKSVTDIVASDLQQVTSKANRSQPQSVSPTLSPQAQVIAFDRTTSETREDGVTGTLRVGGGKSEGVNDSKPDFWCVAQQGVHAGTGEDISPALTSEGVDSSEDGNGRHAFAVDDNATKWDIMRTRIHPDSGVAPTLGANKGRGGSSPTVFVGGADVEALDVRNLRSNGDLAGTLQAKKQGGHSLNYQDAISFVPNASASTDQPVRPHGVSGTTGITRQEGVFTPRIVRRLTPLESERLMGLPDDHTRFDADGKEQSDSARYRQCGNGVVPAVVRWIGERIMKQESADDR